MILRSIAIASLTVMCACSSTKPVPDIPFDAAIPATIGPDAPRPVQIVTIPQLLPLPGQLKRLPEDAHGTETPTPIAAEASVIKPPPRKKEIESPPLSLVGTIASEDEGFGIFLDQSTKTALRLKVGEDYQGWKLRAIRGREVTMEKDEHAAVLTLPQPGGAQSSGAVRLLPVSAIGSTAAPRR